ncbi:MAG: hypothetical protein OXG64_06495 [Chloroflexi bacterium]|nr:hypothetical protein [Chloroflexota bacterium]
MQALAVGQGLVAVPTTCRATQAADRLRADDACITTANPATARPTTGSICWEVSGDVGYR